MPADNLIRLADADKVTPTTRLVATLIFASSSTRSPRSLAVARHSENGPLFAFDNVCPHSGGPLHLGDIEDSGDGDLCIVCPWHSWSFDLRSGATDGHPTLTMDTFVVKEIAGVVCLLLDDLESAELISTTLVQTKSSTLKNSSRPPLALVSSMEPAKTLVEAAVRVLNTGSPSEKVRLAFETEERWKTGTLTVAGNGPSPPDFPAREESAFVAPGKIKKIGKGGNEASRIAILHSLANVEIWAIDLAFDAIARFASYTPAGTTTPLPKAFFDDFVRIAAEEAKHFSLLVHRLEEMGSGFGKLPVHGSLWDSAMDTKDDLLQRLAIVNVVHEARGLDVNPQTIAKFEKAGDEESVRILNIIHNDEITHVAAGQRWFSWICDLKGIDRYSTFHDIVRARFRGRLKPPFNEADRLKAGVDPKYYMPLSIGDTTQ
ncbi:hypothetical protein BJ742DRAFT_775041 [Cladochytrium replicatum]|nr:hypothetical protein BJ742DRAFT_775041 [Cladochytrium replicatum]